MKIAYWVFLIVHFIDQALPLPESDQDLRLDLTTTGPKNQIDETTKTPQNSISEKYGFGTVAVALLSLTAILGIMLLPFLPKKFYQNGLFGLTALAVGTLVSDATIHLIPEILGVSEDNPSNDYVKPYIYKQSAVIGAIYLFWLAEIIFSKLTGGQSAHGHSHGAVDVAVKVETSDNNTSHVFVPQDLKLEDKRREEKRPWYRLGKIKPTAWMLLFSDTIHNCADGLAIGASFANSNSQGISTSIAIICHEIPHELGNYAVLINCGFTHVQAVLANFVSACASFIGFYVAASVSSDDETVSQWIFSITAGMFYYISLVDLLPSLLCDGKWTFSQFILINTCLWIGYIIMLLIAIFEDKIGL